MIRNSRGIGYGNVFRYDPHFFKNYSRKGFFIAKNHTYILDLTN